MNDDDTNTPDDSSVDPDDSSVDPDDDQDPTDDDDSAESFPRPYVERLRARSAGYRHRAKSAEARADELAGELFTARVRALDVLADPSDLPYSAELLDDPDALSAAAADLVQRKPHLGRRGLAGAETGSRERTDSTDSVSLIGMMRGRA